MIPASSIYSLQLPGDGPYWMPTINAMTMCAIPVILDWQAAAYASLFRRLLFESQDRFEDIFVILDWNRAHEQPEYVLNRLCQEVVSGRYRKRQRTIRRIVDYLVYRTDSVHEDAFSLALHQLQHLHEQRQKGNAPFDSPRFAKVKEWPHQADLPVEVTGAEGWDIHSSQQVLRKAYAKWTDVINRDDDPHDV
eukprot:TRINITY_DN11746_c0_g1_i11.p1 TRINITY_DN11746_c0_g1~~TRINITY_DN11746_c0_g1_i11.p1  ORF type:complete len:193 (+),score=20.62 TRINITY_DN11746_c0_g1_i11:1078-1656(+)